MILSTELRRTAPACFAPRNKYGAQRRAETSPENAYRRLLCWSAFFSYGNAYAKGILRRGQEKGEERSAHYGRALRRTRNAKATGPKGLRAGGRPRAT